MESPPISPISRQSAAPWSQPYRRANPPSALGQSHSSSTESLSWHQSTYSRTSSDDSLYLPLESHRSSRSRPSSGRTSSEDSLYVPVNNRQTIKRWNGITREAINWNSLPRDPELFFPTGNCLVYLYPAGHSQRGPSFRIPYHVLLYSGCRPLVQQCLISTLNISAPDRRGSKPLAYGAVDYSPSDDTRTYLYLYPPAGLSRDEGYSYHITTRNFFAWLLGVPLVGTDPVSALIDLKARMDIWRDPNANNFEAIFEYARQQAYGDFEEKTAQTERRIESNGRPERRTRHPSEPVQTVSSPYRHNTGMVHGNDGLKQRRPGTGSRTARSHIASQDKRTEQAPLPVGKRLSLPALTTAPTRPTVPPTAEGDRVVTKMTRPASIQPSSVASPTPAKEIAYVHRYLSSSRSTTPALPVAPADTSGVEAALQRLTGPPSAESVVTGSNSQGMKATKTKRRVSWADNNPTVAESRSSQTDLTYPNMQGLGLQSAQASSSAINVSQASLGTRRSLFSLASSSNPIASPMKSASVPATASNLPWGAPVRAARPMSTASLVSIPTMHQASTPVTPKPCSSCGKRRRTDAVLSWQHHASTPTHLEHCSGCDKMRRPNIDPSNYSHERPRPASVAEPCSCSRQTRTPESGPFHQHLQPPRPASVRSMKSFRSNKSWRSLRSLHSSFSLRSVRSSVSLSSIRSYLSRQTTGRKSFSNLQASMKDRRSAFKARLHRKNKKAEPQAGIGHAVRTEAGVGSPSPNDYATARPHYRYQRSSHNAATPTLAELEAEPVAMKTLPRTASRHYSLRTPEDQPPVVATTTIQPREIYTSREYRYQPTPRRTGNVNYLLDHPDPTDLDPNPGVLDIGTPGGFEEDFVDTLIAQLAVASMGESTVSHNTGKGKGNARTDQMDDDEGGVWMGARSSVGGPGREVRARG